MKNDGLPLPGRELDADVWEMLGHEVYRNRDAFLDAGCPHGIYFNIDCIYPAYWSSKYMNSVPVPEVSTTSAFFQVMEAMQGFGFFEFFQHDRFIVDWHRDPDKPFDCIRIAIPYLDTLEQTFAWGLCAVVWKGKTNEG